MLRSPRSWYSARRQLLITSPTSLIRQMLITGQQLRHLPSNTVWPDTAFGDLLPTRFSVKFGHKFIAVTSVERFDMLKGAAILVVGDTMHKQQWRARLNGE